MTMAYLGTEVCHSGGDDDDALSKTWGDEGSHALAHIQNRGWSISVATFTDGPWRGWLRQTGRAQIECWGPERAPIVVTGFQSYGLDTASVSDWWLGQG